MNKAERAVTNIIGGRAVSNKDALRRGETRETTDFDSIHIIESWFHKR